MGKINLFLKRFIDLFGGIFGVILLTPIFLIIAIFIKTSSEGPIFFKQKRLGLNGESFYILKFRTMINNAENLGDGLTVASESDKRITKIGKILRKTSLDELPQLINVIKGEMSLVGPRPPVTYFPYDGYENYPNWAKKRFTMKPGITGLTQITVRNSVSWNERIIVDNQYVDQFNVWYDIKLLFKTIVKTFKTEDIYMEKE